MPDSDLTGGPLLERGSLDDWSRGKAWFLGSQNTAERLHHQHPGRLLEPSSESLLLERLSGDLPSQISALQSPDMWPPHREAERNKLDWIVRRKIA